MIVYHFTAKESYAEILRIKNLMPSDPWTTMDAAYGSGWYFTDLTPDTCEMAVAYHCWRTNNALERVQYYLKFDIDPSLLKKCRDYVYMLTNWNKNLINYLGGDKNKNCPKKPCGACETGKKYK